MTAHDPIAGALARLDRCSQVTLTDERWADADYDFSGELAALIRAAAEPRIYHNQPVMADSSRCVICGCWNGKHAPDCALAARGNCPVCAAILAFDKLEAGE